MLKRVGWWMLLMLPLSVAAMADSHVRIVRLSSVEGSVQMDRNTGQGYEKAFLNMPVVQGAVLATKADARAEVEFEDGTTLRLTPDSTLEFTELALRDAGPRASTLTLKTGQMYLNFRGSQKGEEFTVLFAGERMRLTEEAHFRIDVAPDTAEVAVFKGEVNVEGAAGTAELSKGKSATFDLTDGDKFSIAKNIEEDPYDEWDKQQAKYHDQYAKSSSYNSYPYGYGVSDLNYYGNYYNVPGYGMMWQPFFTGVGWNPYMDGAWVFYPGFGYTWVSSYPWGWMPYMYGGWNYVSGYGWMWAPGNWSNWTSLPRVTTPPNRNFGPPRPPNRGTATVVVGRGLTAASAIPPRRVLVTPGTAGLGVPRGVSNLRKVSGQVEKSGFATVQTAPPNRSIWSNSNPGYGTSTTAAPHGTSSGSMGRTSSPPMRTGGMSSGGGGRVSAPPHR